MCGIWALFGQTYSSDKAADYLSTLKNRGPEGSKIITGDRYQLGFTRLALNGIENGMQPMSHMHMDWICNGEIYNWKDLARKTGYTNVGGSDCEMLGDLYVKTNDPQTFFNSLHGVFACVLIDKSNNEAIIGRDPFGVRPMFYSISYHNILVASEMKALPSKNIMVFPPGYFAKINLSTLQIVLVRYHEIVKYPLSNLYLTVRNTFMWAIQRRMMTERPVAALLSGGLDSSLVAALVQRELTKLGKPPLQTFSIGFKGSEDLKYARMVADHINSKHTEIIMTPEQFFDAIPQVIYDIESYDITTVRASVGNWLVAREIARQTDCKVVFNGDGADELFGGYLYLHKAPTNVDFENECNRLLKNIHFFDVLRSDRTISSHGLEPRTPFLDKDFVNIIKSIPISLRRPTSSRIEKWVLRKSFDIGILPEKVLWRKKEAFSDGVSGKERSWFEECQSRSLLKVPEWNEQKNMFSYLEPYTAESFYYRKLFSEHYASDKVIPYFWMPKWSPETTDPSARTLEPAAVNAS